MVWNDVTLHNGMPCRVIDAVPRRPQTQCFGQRHRAPFSALLSEVTAEVPSTEVDSIGQQWTAVDSSGQQWPAREKQKKTKKSSQHQPALASTSQLTSTSQQQPSNSPATAQQQPNNSPATASTKY
jgi:hypothetical protein